MKFFRILPFCLLLLAFNACKKSQVEEPPDMGYDYYPGRVGSYIIYDVDSFSYRKINNDTLIYKFQVKEKVDSQYTDNQGRPTLKIVRYKKVYNDTIPYSQMSWEIQDVWAANLTKTTAEVVEENVRFVKLIFPVKKNATWNGNAQNTIGEWDYKYSEIDAAANVGGNAFEKTLKVTQKYFLSAINKQNYFERYAKGVGMIYRIIEDYDYQDGNGNANPGHIYGGTFYEMRINSYGTE